MPVICSHSGACNSFHWISLLPFEIVIGNEPYWLVVSIRSAAEMARQAEVPQAFIHEAVGRGNLCSYLGVGNKRFVVNSETASSI